MLTPGHRSFLFPLRYLLTDDKHALVQYIRDTLYGFADRVPSTGTELSPTPYLIHPDLKK
jgi:hypothetical protein